MRLRGEGAVLEAAGRLLDFRFGAGGREGRFLVPAERCVSVAARLVVPGDGLRLVFRFRLAPAAARTGGTVAVSVVVPAGHADEAWQFVRALVSAYGIRDVTWPDGRTDGYAYGSGSGPAGGSAGADRSGGPVPIPGDDPDWVRAPVSARTAELWAWMTRRPAVPAGPDSTDRPDRTTPADRTARAAHGDRAGHVGQAGQTGQAGHTDLAGPTDH